MKKVFLVVLMLGAVQLFAQSLSKNDESLLKSKEDSMQRYAFNIIQGRTPEDRFRSDSVFTRMFVRALVVKNSFNYPFDSLITISKLYPSDSSFRIFTWQMVINENMVRQHGAIQMRTPDGSLKLYPLIDKSDITLDIADTFANNKGWIGAVYYKLVETKNGNQPYYTLLGFDENNIRSDRKIIETMTFQNDEPVFGGRLFSFEDDAVKKSSVGRYIMEYKKDAGSRLTYDPDLDMIVFEHLQSETNEPTKKWTYIPDGDYEGFKWKNGKWVHIEKVFTQVTPEGQEPVPSPVKTADGKTIEENLQMTNEPTGTEDPSIKPKNKPAAKPKKKP